ncbi:hypothetical protein DL96DRAFT_1473985, partial [Flagelloscypha sp. PMI_526]
TLRVMNNLASGYSDLFQHESALKHERKVLANKTWIMEDEDSDTLTSMGNLAVTYSVRAWSDTLELQEQVLALCVQGQENKHPVVLVNISNLTVTYSALGQHKDALKWKEHGFSLRTQIL